MNIPIKSQEGHTFYVKESFLLKCPNPSEYFSYDLFNTYNMRNYLHNLDGPAILTIEGLRSYWINGENIPDQEAERIIHNYKFSNKMSDLINSDD